MVGFRIAKLYLAVCEVGVRILEGSEQVLQSKMYLQLYINENSNKVYTTKKGTLHATVHLERTMIGAIEADQFRSTRHRFHVFSIRPSIKTDCEFEDVLRKRKVVFDEGLEKKKMKWEYVACKTNPFSIDEVICSPAILGYVAQSVLTTTATGSNNSVDCAQNVLNTNYIGTKNMITLVLTLMRTRVEIIIRFFYIIPYQRKADVALKHQLEDTESLPTMNKFLEQAYGGSWVQIKRKQRKHAMH
ncbi:hypothetical protein Tco_0465600 [Tanacetum coccineum]